MSGSQAFSPIRFGGPASAGGSGGSSGAPARVVRYTATGGETDFNVPIGFSMPTDDYAVAPGLVDVASSVAIQCPNALAADRTTTTFRVITDPLTVGDKLEFILTPA